jgi:DNA polymerase-1
MSTTASTGGEDRRLFLLDAMALIYRAHFAFIRNPRVTSDGRNTSAVYGFVTSLLEILENEQPTHLGVAFDTERPTFRHQQFADYKANREAPPEDVRIAQPIIKQMLDAWHIPVLQKDGYEADDVIATLAVKAAEAGFTTYMMTPDKDFGQVVNERILLYVPSRMGKPSYVMDSQAVCEKWQIKDPQQLIDILALMGDSIDNIPGVPGIGEKTAAKLIRQFGSVESLLAGLDQLKGKQREKLAENQEQLRLSRQLATIDTNAPVHFDPEALRIGDKDEAALYALFKDLEFRSIIRRVWPESTAESSAAPSSSEAEPNAAVAEKQRFQPGAVVYRLLEDEQAIADWLAQLAQAHAFAFDTETDGLNPLEARLVGVSLARRAGEAVYIPIPQEEAAYARRLELLAPAFADARQRKIAQNAKFDLEVLHQWGIEVKGPLFDTMIGHYLLEQDSRHSMDVLAGHYLGYEPIAIETLLGPKGKNQLSMDRLAPAQIRDYACEDADITWRLGERIAEELRREALDDLYWKVEAPLVPVLAGMERSGIGIDREALAEFSQELGQELEKLEANIYEMAGLPFNLNSPKQLGDVLFDHLGLQPKPKRTRKTSQYSTSEDILQQLAQHYDIAARLLDYRSVQKLKSTYVDKLPELISPRTGKIHTSFNQAVAATGRLSSNNPNLQNIPIRTELGRRIRKAFIPARSDGFILSADYSQIELRLIAAISGDEAMLEAFRKREDIHTATAARVFEVAPEEVTADLRRQAKTVNFGIIYGISAFGLSQRLGLSRQRSAEIIEAYFEKYPGIKRYMDETIDQAREKGYVSTPLGRKRKLPDINSSNPTTRGYAERNAINSPIQGAAADMIKLAMIRVDHAMREQGLRSRMVLQVHDELLFDVQAGEEEAVRALAVEHMRDAMEVEVPIEVETGLGRNWLEAH